MSKLIKKNPFSVLGCLHPRSIYNKYLGERVTVGCGKCDACRIAKADSRTAMLNLVSELSASTFFGTLTFDDEHMPVMEFDNSDWNVPFDQFFDVFGTFWFHDYHDRKGKLVKRSYGSERVMSFDQFSLDSYEKNLMRQGMSYTDGRPSKPFVFGYLRKKDLQKFFKRLRKFLNSHFDGSIYYFAVGEYGPQSLRPHFHFVLCSNNVLPYQTLLDGVSRCWKLGRIDLQSVQSNAASYVAGYLTSSARLPSWLRKEEVRPFFIQSHFKSYALSLQDESEEKIRNWYFQDAHERVVQTSDGCATIPLSKSVVSLLYPRCTNFHGLSLQGLYQRYEDFDKGFIKVRVNSLVSPSNDRWSTVPCDDLCRLSQTFLGEVDGQKTFLIEPSIYRDYLWYKNVGYLSALYHLPVKHVICRIYQWWNDEDYRRLVRLYDRLEGYSDGQTLISLLKNNDVFYWLSRNTPWEKLPKYLQQQFDLQGLSSVLFDYLGNSIFDCSNFSSDANYQLFERLVSKESYDRIKTKGVNDLYNPL